MGLLVDGQWQDKWYDTDSNNGKFKREAAQLRNWITKDGSPGPTGSGGFKAQANRYHLYVALACPWAHRTLIFIQLKGLSDIISVSVVSPDMLDRGGALIKITSVAAMIYLIVNTYIKFILSTMKITVGE